MLNYDNIERVIETRKTLKTIKILQNVDLTTVSEEYVRNSFQKAYAFLIEKEQYETCAELKKIEQNYDQQLKKKTNATINY